MWFRIQSEGFITAAQTGGDIPPNWGHQSSCCCVLSSVQIASFFFFKFIHFPFSPFSFPSLFLSLSLAPYRWDLFSLAVGYTPPPRLHFKWRHCAGAAPRYRQAERNGEGGARAGAIARSWCFITAPHLDIWGRLFSHEHQCVINRINLGPNFLMIAVLMYVNECSLLTHYRQFAWDTHNQTL